MVNVRLREDRISNDTIRKDLKVEPLEKKKKGANIKNICEEHINLMWNALLANDYHNLANSIIWDDFHFYYFPFKTLCLYHLDVLACLKCE